MNDVRSLTALQPLFAAEDSREIAVQLGEDALPSHSTKLADDASQVAGYV